MKFTIPCFVLLFILYSFPFLLTGCGDDSNITQPNIGNITNLAKSNPAFFVKIDHSADTIMTFPKSGKIFVVNKNYTANQLSQIDNYLASHTPVPINTKFFARIIQDVNCTNAIEYSWELQNKYQTAPGKYLGIWCDYLTPAQCLNYGFNQLFITGDTSSISSAISGAVNSGFSAGNLMVNLGSSNSAAAGSIINGTPNVGYYFIDEPFETKAFGDSILPVIPNLAKLIKAKNPSGKLLLSSYFLPYTSICNGISALTGSNGLNSDFENLFSLDSNIFVMCDDYYSNCCDSAAGYWDAFRSYYGSRNISNWLSVVINNGSTGYYEGLCSTGYSTGWAALFDNANTNGINNVWLYAYMTGNDSAVSDFAYTAWSRDFTTRQASSIETIWTCSQDSCSDCSFPNKGTWSISAMYIISNGVLLY
jgi:hypothetical protein